MPDPNPNPNPAPTPDPKPADPKPDPRDQTISDLTKRLEALEGKNKPPPDDPDLQEKAKREREAKEKKASDAKSIEAALRFSMGAKDWLKLNASILPKDIEGIFAAAEKETYDSAVEKDAAIKSALVSSFFQVQANVDLLTPSQKSALEDFQKLTKNGRHEKAATFYEQIFEPTFEMLKRLKKAEQLGKAGHATNGDSTASYMERMSKLSEQHYTGRKADA